ncbi:transmembrane channel-like protein 5 [Sorex fumeus]|uniref:transmembrane channel-like protein 5 n=1 Tax=Sorex fumeus TaxID=62283 RepID=UPI0024ACFA91|nr:transmembrane channel-like protein 5 [Sorex fumeus]
MSAYYRNYGYEDDPDDPDYLGPRNQTQGPWKTQASPDSRGPWTSLQDPSPRNGCSAGSRPSPGSSSSLAGLHHPGSWSNPDPSGTRHHPHAVGAGSPQYPRAFEEPDYPGSRRDPYHSESRRNPGLADSQHRGNYVRPRTNPNHLASWEEPDYPGAQGSSSNHLGSQRNPGYAASSTQPNLSFLSGPDYPGAKSQAQSRDPWGEPDYFCAKDYQKSPGFWEEPDYPGADGYAFGPSKTQKTTRDPPRRTSSVQPSFQRGGASPWDISPREHEDHPETFELSKMATPLDHSGLGDPGAGFAHLAHVGEINPGCAYGVAPLSGCDWNKPPQVQKLIATLAPMTLRERNKAIRSQPRTMDEKRILRKLVSSEKSKQPRRLELGCCTQCLDSVSQGYQRARNGLSELLSAFNLWQKTFKVIGGKFGTSVLSYFNFLRWLWKFNIFSFIMTFSFLVIPQLTMAEKNNLPFTGLEFFTGSGYFNHTVMYYGFYTNSTIQHGTGPAYNMQLAYLFTVAACLVVCFFALLFSMARYFRNNFINPHIYSSGIAKLIFCWDFTITNEKAVKLKQKNLSMEIRENLSEMRQEQVKLTARQRLLRLSAHLAAWLVSTGVAAACCTAVYYLAENNTEFLQSHQNPGAVLLLPFVVSCINLAVPRFYSMFRLVEHYELPRHEVYSLLIRNIFLKMSIIGILCYYWLNVVALSGQECWETLIGQEIYRLLLMDFVFSVADSLLGEFLRRIIGTYIVSLGSQEFDIARNVLELIYEQTLVWAGTFFCPLLPFIQMINLFIMFYVKNVSLRMNFQPPSKAWRASQMVTFFILLLFFPSFSGVLCTMAITIWRLKPSVNCGPFRGLPSFIHAIYSWIDALSHRPSALWVVWVYRNLIGSVHFFFILTLIVLIITYLYWQITEGRKVMIRLLHEQIINEGKDKMFLIEKLARLQDAEKRPDAGLGAAGRNVEPQSPVHVDELEDASDLRFRRSFPEENPNAW